MSDNNRSRNDDEGRLNPPSSAQHTGVSEFTFIDSGRARVSGAEDIPTNPQPPHETPTETSAIHPDPLEGIITLIQRTEEEPPTDWYRFLSQTILVILTLPILLTLGIGSLALAIAFAILGFSTLSSIFNPVSWLTLLFEMLEVVVLGRLQRSSQHTVYRGLVRDTQDRVFAFYLHGALRSGILVEGHHVRLAGDWRRENRHDANERGTLFVSQGQDLSTGSTLYAAGNAWRPVFCVLLALLVGIVVAAVIKLP